MPPRKFYCFTSIRAIWDPAPRPVATRPWPRPAGLFPTGCTEVEAKELAAAGRFGAAIGLELKALELDPRLTQAHINLMSLYGRLDNAAKAESRYRQAVALNPNAYEAYYNFGVICYRLGRRAEAQAAFAKTVAINPGYADAHNNLGALLQEQGRLDEAVRHFRKAIDLQPGLRLPRFHMGRIYANRRFPQAIDQFERAVAVDDEATPMYALGATRARAGDKSGAVATLGQGIRIWLPTLDDFRTQAELSVQN